MRESPTTDGTVVAPLRTKTLKEVYAARVKTSTISNAYARRPSQRRSLDSMVRSVAKRGTLITPALFSRPLPPPTPGEEGENKPERASRMPPMPQLPPLGAHVSVAGGMVTAIERATALGCTAAQVFVKNANQWQGRELSEEEVAAFRAARA